MTTITTLVPSTTLDEKHPAFFQKEVCIEQREQSLPYRQKQHTTQDSPQAQPQPSPRTTQSALLLKAAREPYTLATDHAIPALLHKDEILIKVTAIGLNPIDWKGPAYNFGIPALPWINGRDLAGTVTQVPEHSRLRKGDLVLVPSTDYRDIRKAAFQEYVVATHFNAARIPASQCATAAASVGVAFVASALALGVSLGVDFGVVARAPGPDFGALLGSVERESIPEDIRGECFGNGNERVRGGEWVVIWGASTTTGFITLQLARLAGLKVICVADVARHGARLLEAGASVLVDRFDTARAVEIIRGITKGKLRYAIDIVGKDTATLLQSVLDPVVGEDGSRAHLLGLTGLPKERDERIIYHTVPIKLFHSSSVVGEAMVTWLEELLETKTLEMPEIVRVEGGLGSVNESLEMLRRGDASGKRIVIDML